MSWTECTSKLKQDGSTQKYLDWEPKALIITLSIAIRGINHTMAFRLVTLLNECQSIPVRMSPVEMGREPGL